ncbi:MAG: response regulator, partial [Bacteroidota bacterium]
ALPISLSKRLIFIYLKLSVIMKKVDKVFIIDDDSIFLYSLQKLLTNFDFAKEVKTFVDAEEAIIFFEDHANQPTLLPELIFLDIAMPMMSGWEFLQDFEVLYHQISKKMDLFVVSSSISKLDIEKAKSYPVVVDYITKPITSQVLQQILQKQRVA